MKGLYLKFYMHENYCHQSILAYKWLLEQAEKLGIHGGSAIRAIAGFGRNGLLHEEQFFELAGDLPVVVEFAISEEETERLLALIREEKLSVFYVKIPAEFGLTLEGS